MRLALLSLILLANCAAPASSRQVARIDAERRTEEEQREQSRADLEELLARAKAKPRAPQSTPVIPVAPAAPIVAAPADPFDDLLPAGQIAAEVIARFHKAGPHTLLRALETEPARLNGKLLGYRIVSVAPDAAFLRRAQLLPGDIITAVNGAPLLTPDDFMKLWSSLPTLAALDVNLLRGSESVTKRWVIGAQPAAAP